MKNLKNHSKNFLKNVLYEKYTYQILTESDINTTLDEI